MQKVKVKFESPHFIVSGKMVICKLNFSIDSEVFSSRIGGSWNAQNKLGKRFPDYIRLIEFGQGTMTAKAKCHESDEFDEERGKRIAESRATYKVHELIWRMLEAAYTFNVKDLASLYTSNAISQSIIAIREFEHLKTLL